MSASIDTKRERVMARRRARGLGAFLRPSSMWIICLLYVVPLYLFVSLGARSSDASTTNPFGLDALTGENFQTAWTDGALGASLVNTAVITVGSLILIIGIGAPAGYWVARRVGRTSRFIGVMFLFGLLLPIQLGLLPLYRALVELGLIGNLGVMMLYYLAQNLPFAVFLIAGFSRGLPQAFEEAAIIDGAGPTRLFWWVVFPLLRPVVATIVILQGISIWNDFLAPLLFLSGSGYQTVTVSVFSFVGEYTANWNLVFAGLLIAILPLLIAYFLLQRHIVEGFEGGVRG